MTLTFDFVNPKSIGVFYLIWTIIMRRILGAKLNFIYAPETVFNFKVKVTLTCDLVAQKSTGLFYTICTIIL
jgi:hypothetical protein